MEKTHKLRGLIQSATPRETIVQYSRVKKIQCRTVRRVDWSLRRSPSLELVGDWFERAGFDIGSTVKIEVSNGKIVISNLQL